MEADRQCTIQMTDEGGWLRLVLQEEQQNGEQATDCLTAGFESSDDTVGEQVLRVYIERGIGYLFPVVCDASKEQRRLLQVAALRDVGIDHPLVAELTRSLG